MGLPAKENVDFNILDSILNLAQAWDVADSFSELMASGLPATVHSDAILTVALASGLLHLESNSFHYHCLQSFLLSTLSVFACSCIS